MALSARTYGTRNRTEHIWTIVESASQLPADLRIHAESAPVRVAETPLRDRQTRRFMPPIPGNRSAGLSPDVLSVPLRVYGGWKFPLETRPMPDKSLASQSLYSLALDIASDNGL